MRKSKIENMHTFSENSAGVPAFLAKLWRLVEDEETNHLIYWSADGKSFIIQNQAQFARDILPLNYKHNNMASFIRQLNMYGFHKITSLDGGGLKFDRDEMEFSHPYFQRDHPYLMEHIKRKISTAKTTNTDDKSNVKHEIVSKVLNDVKLMRGRQDSLDNRFVSMKQENEALWREVAILRQKHIKQQQIVNKLIQFLVTIVQPNRGSGISSMGGMSGVKRRYQLMINDVPDASKVRKTTRSSASPMNEGPVIRELTEELLDTYNDGDEEANSPYVVSPGGFQAASIHDYEDDDNISDDQIITDDDGSINGNANVSGVNSNNTNRAIQSYNTADYNSDLIYEKNSKKNIKPIISLLSNDDGSSVDDANVDDIQVEELLGNVTSGATFSNVEQTAKQPQQQQQQQQQQQRQVLGGTRKIAAPSATIIKGVPRIESNVVVANTPSGIKRFPIVIGRDATKSQQLANQTQPTNVLRSNAAGKSLLDAQKIKAVRQQQIVQQAQQLQQQHHHQQQQQQQPKQIIQTIPVPQEGSNKPILITVGKTLGQVPTTSLQNAATAEKSYKNKTDFISSEIPTVLFENDDSQGNFDNSNVLSDVNSVINNPLDTNELAGSFGDAIPNIVGAGGASDNMTVAKYNSRSIEDDIQRINSSDSLHQHLDNVQGDLEALKEFLRNGDEYQLDANALLSGPNGESFMNVISKLFGENDAFQNYSGIPINPTNASIIGGLDDRDRSQENPATSSDSALMNYQPVQTPIDFTEFLNLDENPVSMNDADSAANMPILQNNNNIQSAFFGNPNGDLATQYVKQEQFAFPK